MKEILGLLKGLSSFGKNSTTLAVWVIITMFGSLGCNVFVSNSGTDDPLAILDDDDDSSDDDDDTVAVVDTDGDGISDDDEATYGTSPTDSDTDNDGLTDFEEIYQTVTDPKTADTDGDGWSDGAETAAQTDPNDSVSYPTDVTCIDEDSDTYGTLCAAGPDCNDSSADVNPAADEVCGDTIDQDCSGKDLACPPACNDNDGDGYGVGSGCSGPDCDDSDSTVHTGCSTVCTDSDGDGYGDGCTDGNDCDDEDADNWISCLSCKDNDNDDFWSDCDAYTTVDGPDCDDTNPTLTSDCNPTCTDNDGDGYGVGAGCLGEDCDDNDSAHYFDCAAGCTDADSDGYGVGSDCTGADCDDSDAAVWAWTEGYADYDQDGYTKDTPQSVCTDGTLPPELSASASLTADCSDGDENNWMSCSTCVDTDYDGWYVDCDAYISISGPDCDEGDANLNIDCSVTCTDNDLDGYGIGTGCAGDDCDDYNDSVWVSCGACVDDDLDGWYTGCDQYLSIEGPDCDDTAYSQTNDCSGGCTDVDQDTYGVGCAAGDDCDDNDENVWASCATCVDNDVDTFYTGCDQYLTINGPDCDDSTYSSINDCSLGCTDVDQDTYGTGCAAGDDCNDNDANHWADCGLCTDNDADGYGDGCDLGVDCDDNLDTGASCSSGCLDYYEDSDSDSYGNAAVVTTACQPPVGTVSDNTDCNDLSADHWSDCGNCVDADGDARGAGCDLGADCDDEPATGTGCFDTCTTYFDDVDGDSYGNSAASVSACLQPGDTVTVGGDCDDTTADHWSDCGICADSDGDNRGAGCDLGPDCDDTPATGTACFDTCVDYFEDADSDSFGNAAIVTPACQQPIGSVADDTDCNDNDSNNWASCITCADGDGDNNFDGCDAYITLNGPDCDDGDTDNWSMCANCVDGDGDNWFVQCDRFITRNGPDCDDGMAVYTNNCGSCIDMDGDGHGLNCAAGADCDDADENNWFGCASCADADTDGWFAGCDAYVSIQGPDCDDSTAARNPGLLEVYYNDIDDDCDVATDDWDQDGDGFTDPGAPYGSRDDCDDTRSNIHPGAAEVYYNNIDDDCDPTTDDWDQDGDGYTAFGAPHGSADDCNDTEPAAHPGAAELYYSGIDEDCLAATVDDDQDGDGIPCTTCSAGMTQGSPDCEDADPAIWTIVTAYADSDNDGFTVDVASNLCTDGSIPGGYFGTVSPNVDCDDGDSNIRPNAIDFPNNNVDEDCDPTNDLIENGMSGYWSMQSNVAGVIPDDSGNGHDMDVLGSNAFNLPGVAGNALQLNTGGATGSYLYLGQSAAIGLNPVNNQNAFAAWIKPENFKHSVVMSKSGGSSYGYRLLIEDADGTGAWNYRCYWASSNSSGAKYFIGTPASPLNEWAHVACSYDGNTARIFINGAEANSAVFGLANRASDSPFEFGKDWDGAANDYQGYIDEARVWTRPLREVDAFYLFNMHEPGATGMKTLAYLGDCFLRGDSFSEGDIDETPYQNVCLSRFSIDAREVTNAEYQACEVAGACNPPVLTTSATRVAAPYYGNSAFDNYPVIHISWNDAATYCSWIGKRLPTEAEWEYAARGGTVGRRYPSGDILGCSLANYDRTSIGSCYNYSGLANDTHPVGSYPVNGYGLVDFAGNVAEWVSDWYNPSYYTTLPDGSWDPQGPVSGTQGKSVRGGSWLENSTNQRISGRSNLSDSSSRDDLGFRCAQ